jgi:hypothetical protein
MICSSMCLLRFIVWPFLRARLQIRPGSIQGGNVRARTELLFLVALAALRAELRQSLHGLRNGVLDLQGRAAEFQTPR